MGKKVHLDYLKALAALYVVIGHSITYLENYSSIPNWGRVCSVFVSSVHVPMFFLIAGYLCHKQPIGMFIWKKVKRIIIPCWFFTFIKFLINVFGRSGFAHSSSMGQEFINAFILGGYYWFVYCLFIIFLIAPFLWKFGKIWKIVFCIIGFAFNIGISVLNIELFPATISLFNFEIDNPFFQVERVMQYLPYFVLGLVIADNKADLYNIFQKKRGIIVSTSCVTMLVLLAAIWFGTLEKNYLVKMLLAFSQMIAYYSLSLVLPPNLIFLEKLGNYSLQVMLFDGFLRVTFFAIIVRIANPNMMIALLIAILEVIVTCMICTLIKSVRLKIINDVIGI